MGFLDTVQLPTSTALPTSKDSGFLGSVILPPNPAQAQKMQDYAGQAQVAQANADYTNSFAGTVKNTLGAIGDIGKAGLEGARNVLNAPVAPKGLNEMGTAFLQGGQSIIDAVKKAGNDVVNAASTAFDTHTSLLQKGTSAAQAGLSTVNAVFSPLSALTNDIASVPVLGYVGDAVNKVFGAIGEGAGSAAVKTLDDSSLSQTTKDQLRPIVHDTVALVAQIIAGKGGEDLYTKLGDKTKTATDIIKNEVQKAQATPAPEAKPQGFLYSVQLPKESPQIAPESPQIAPKTTPEIAPTLQQLAEEAQKYSSAEEFVKAQGKPVYHGTDVASIVDKEGFKKMPIKTGVSAFGEGSYLTDSKANAKGYGGIVEAYLPKDIKLKNVSDSDAYTVDTQKLIKEGYDGTVLDTGNGKNITIFDQSKIKTKSQLTDFYNKVKTETPNVEQSPNTRAIILEKAAVEKKLTESLGQLPTHDRMDMKNQASLAVDYIEKNPEEALKVAKGEALPPHGVLAESIYTAREIKAIREKDIPTMQELAQSKIATHAGQSLKALDSNDPNSPVKIMRDIQQAREAALEKKGGVKSLKSHEVKAMKKEIVKNVSKRPTWEEFIKEVQCNY